VQPPPSVWNPPQPSSLAPEGQSPSKYMHCSVGCIPASAAVAQKFSLPISVVIHPLNDVAGEEEVPVVNFGSTGVIRCRRCRTYVNPFVVFIDAGRRWRCNVCGLLNDVPSDYYCNLDSNGKRRDITERPELSCGTVEYVAPADYMVRPPQPPSFVFVIDVSARAVQTGMVREACTTIRSILSQLPGQPRTQVGFLTFDSSFHFYNLKSTLSEPQMLAVPDLDDPFLPLPSELLVNLNECRGLVDALLEKIPSTFANTTNPDSALGPALQAACAMMQHVGGKLQLFQACQPTLGKAQTRPREDTSLLGTDKESTLLNPSTDSFKTLALEVCSKSQISVDLFCCCEGHADLATLVPVAKYTNGQIFHYPNFEASRDADTFRADLIRSLTRPMGFEAVMRIRASQGVKVSAFHGNHYLRGADLLALPTIDADKAFSCDLQLEEQSLTCSHVAVQCALLYTTSQGERRIRVHNLNLPVSTNMQDLYTTLDTRATMNVLLKTAVEQAMNTKLMDARSRLQSACVNCLRGHRLMCQGAELTEEAKLLPIYVLAALKSLVLRDGVEVRADERSMLMMMVGSATTHATASMLYPSMFALHRLSGTPYGLPGSDGVVQMPPLVRLSTECLEAEGLYLLDTGYLLLLWIGKNAHPQALMELLNLDSAERLDGAKVNLPQLQTDLSQRALGILNRIRQSHPLALSLYTVRQGGAAESKMLQFMVEDRTLSTMSYPEWWNALSRQLQ